MQETWALFLGQEDFLEKVISITSVFLPGQGESHGQRSLAGYSPWDHSLKHNKCFGFCSGSRTNNQLWAIQVKNEDDVCAWMCIHTYTCTHVYNVPLMCIMTFPFSQIGSSGNEEEWLDSVYIWKVVSTEFPSGLDVGDEWEESDVTLRLLVNSQGWNYRQWRWWKLCIQQIWDKMSGVGFESVGAIVSVRHSSGGCGSVGGTQAKAASQEWAGEANQSGF